ncbi:MAG: tRNA pseudouridine(38-40) synthase TruA [Alphaproteobacteria bacterium]|nr:tRNA pseudouridine(38-40) synthase TruA [Alphaproteobacteria bacterium]MBU0792690.1 tRNA pseudouridine(38-40) synthase TruA [Alphaproteobacteria bacterium]MBU0877305.1 tRNA pseudouridine(38-40) synthase TruA [Alphaproteobacteria bacterium]MBU1770520.1 tRNA pseudouridine(38-40) synthase TruA [Alphaproteobacteria bacterium]
MTRFAFTVEYDGRPYMGWQRQAHGPTVQQHIEEALGRIVGDEPIVHCAGRTDAGVHATGMRAHVDLDKAITPFRLMEALNAHLRPEPIAILACEIVSEDWHARFSCVARAYEYRILNRRAPLTFESGLVWRVPQILDADRMHSAAQALVGRHDFTTFRSAQCQADSPLRTLSTLDVVRTDERITIHAKARSFLHHQVRSMVGCLALVGMGTWSPEDLRAALEARDRSALGHNAPPDGLYFMHADYPETAC